jgi:hypothetical protein
MATRLRVPLLAAVILLGAATSAQPIGITVSAFLPRGGRFSQPIYPLSIQDAGLSLGRYFRLAGSLSLYSITAMGITDAEGRALELEGPAVGAFPSLLGSVAGQVVIPIKINRMVKLEIVGLGGVFGCWNFDPPLILAPLERYLASAASGGPYDAVVATLDSDGRWGWGWLFGGHVTWYVGPQLGLTFGARYYLGGAPLRLSGTFDGYTSSGGVATETVLPPPLRGARLDFRGLELLAGVAVQL